MHATYTLLNHLIKEGYIKANAENKIEIIYILNVR